MCPRLLKETPSEILTWAHVEWPWSYSDIFAWTRVYKSNLRTKTSHGPIAAFATDVYMGRHLPKEPANAWALYIANIFRGLHENVTI